jgi:hypothetical protein
MEEPSYFCLAGHPVPADALDTVTEVQTLDDGAQVRVCREHGAPIGTSIRDTRDGSRSNL